MVAEADGGASAPLNGDIDVTFTCESPPVTDFTKMIDFFVPGCTDCEKDFEVKYFPEASTKYVEAAITKRGAECVQKFDYEVVKINGNNVEDPAADRPLDVLTIDPVTGIFKFINKASQEVDYIVNIIVINTGGTGLTPKK